MQDFFRSDRWIPWSFVAGFAVILLANGIMVFTAFDSWTGVSTDDAYRRGLEYNRQLAQNRKAFAIGWSVSASIAGRDRRRSVTVFVTDRAGRPLPHARVSARFERPIERDLDFKTDLAGGASAGLYTGRFTLPKFGQWRVVYTVTARGETLTATRRYDLRP